MPACFSLFFIAHAALGLAVPSPKAAFQEVQLVADVADFYTRIGTGDYLYGPGQPLGVGDLDVDGKVRPEFPQSRLRVGGRDWLRGSRERACVWERERECVRYVEGR